MPRLHAFQIDYGPHGFQSMPINLEDDWDVIKIYARQYASLYLKDNGSFYTPYRQNGYIPLNYIIDTAGIVRYVAEGWNEAAERQVIEQYLPDPIEHDVGVTRLIAPTGNPDSGAVIVPACSLENGGNYAETYDVRMRIGADYDTTVTISNHAPGEQLYVEFPAWAARGRGLVAVTCTTELAGDDIGSNNSKNGTVTVNVYDIAVTAILAPADSVDSGATVVPAAEVKNLGTLADMAKVRFYIGDFYLDSVNVPLQPGRTDTAMLDAWIPALLGTFPVRCTVATLRADMIPSNNELDKSVVVVSTGIEEQYAGRPRFALFGGRSPAGRTVEIRYSLAGASAVDLKVYSAGGKLVRTLASGVQAAGSYQAVWNRTDDAGRQVGQGIYFCRLVAGDFRAARKLTIVE